MTSPLDTYKEKRQLLFYIKPVLDAANGDKEVTDAFKSVIDDFGEHHKQSTLALLRASREEVANELERKMMLHFANTEGQSVAYREGVRDARHFAVDTLRTTIDTLISNIEKV